MSKPHKDHPNYLPLPIDKIPANEVVPVEIYIYMPANGKMLLYKEESALLGPVKHARMHEFRDRFFYKKEDQPKLEAFLKAGDGGDIRPAKALAHTPHFLAGANTKEELQKRSADLLSGHFSFTFDPSADGTAVEQMQRHINQVTQDVLEVLEVEAGVLDKLKAWLSSIESDQWNHSSNVACISALLAMAIGYTDKDLLRDIATAGYLHDIGLSTCSLPPGKDVSEYDAAELERYLQHPAAGLELLEILELPISENVKIIVYQHEEKFDGTGFPTRSSGPDLFEPSQLVALASRLDHLIRLDRPQHLSLEEALRKIGHDNTVSNGSVSFSPVLLNQIFDSLGKQPDMLSDVVAA